MRVKDKVEHACASEGGRKSVKGSEGDSKYIHTENGKEGIQGTWCRTVGLGVCVKGRVRVSVCEGE